MIRVKIFDIKQFRCFFDVVSNEGELILSFEPEGLNVSVLTKNHVCYFNVYYDNAFFLEYDVESSEKVIVDADEFYKVLKSGRNGEHLTIIFNANIISYIFNNDDVTRRVIETPVIDSIYDNVPQPPSIDTLCESTLSLDSFRDCLNDAKNILKVGKVKLVTDNSNFIIKSTNTDMVNYENTIIDSLCTGKDSVGEYNIDFLLNLLKFKDIDKMVTLKFGVNIPLLWNIISQDKLVECSGLIAPRLEEDG